MSNELELLQGIWNIASVEMDGMKLPALMLMGARVAIERERFTASGMGADYAGTLVIDGTARPRQLDMVFDAGPEQGNRNLCIYELDGDSLKLCIALKGTVRPAEFAAPPGSGFVLETLTRAAPDHGPRKRTGAA